MHRLLHFLMRTLRLQLCLLLGLGFGVPEGRALSLYTNHPTVAEALTSAAEEISELAKDPLRLTPRVAVVDLVERLHRERNPVSTILEERLAQMLEERLGQQSVPFKKLEQLRAEWNSDFPGRTSQQLVEDLAGQAEADWMITGTHHQEEGFLKISLQLYELATESILWQTLLEAPVVEVETTQAETPVPAPPEPAEIMTEFKFVQPQTAEPQPQTISRASTPEPAVLSEETALLAEAVDALPEPTAESAPNFGFVAEGIDEPLEEEIEEPLAEEVTGESFAEPWQLAMIEPPQAEVRLTPEPVIPEGMRLIPGGEFMMGSSTGRADETPDHRVEVRSFLMGQHEVTNAEYARCDSCERGTGGFDTTDFDQPAVYVDWENAQAYCKSRGYRLPTEVEWEYAARSEIPDLTLLGGIPCCSANMLGSQKTLVMQAVGPLNSSGKSVPTPLNCTTCTAMCSNGWRTTTLQTTSPTSAFRTTRRGRMLLSAQTIPCAWRVAVRGTDWTEPERRKVCAQPAAMPLHRGPVPSGLVCAALPTGILPKKSTLRSGECNEQIVTPRPCRAGASSPANPGFGRGKATLERRGVSSSTHGEDVSNELWTKPVKASKHSSSWPEYEVEALIAARIAGQSEEKIQRLIAALQGKAIRFSSHQDKTIEKAHYFILDTVGYLGRAYSYADVAYVGGAAGETGLHNILEAATFGIPIITGAHIDKFPEAIRLRSLAGLYTVTSSAVSRRQITGTRSTSPLLR